ncbi:MAG TPA: response regulator, partial [Flavobacteriales bacterium]
NLLNNAAKYTPPGGDIALRVADDGSGHVEITVSDNGIGIREQDLGRVFDMFTHLEQGGDRLQNGLGIGLHIVQRLTHMHGGQVKVESPGAGQGSRFTVTLPLVDADDRVPSAPVEEHNHRPPLRVMVVDDNVDAAFVLSMILKRERHDVHATHGGLQAVELAASFKPDVIFLDIGMPGMDGYEACRRIRALPGLKHTHMVALTGWGQEQDKERAREAGFHEHLVKPAERAVIMQVLDRVGRMLAVH